MYALGLQQLYAYVAVHAQCTQCSSDAMHRDNTAMHCEEGIAVVD
jgi:hypothetical protein